MEKHYGNLQKIKDGKRTYAITPHIIGGFVTPDQLEKFASVARKYKGVLKLTTGQRILITNLKEENLSAIWQELDMSPAVINQYSVKNVEICPAGFCKRAKHNITALGVRISKKYHGAEMPNRTKIAVVGCRNACGSAYGKDVAVIADKNGFIVAVGGSAGFNPRLADIIARDIREEEALKLVDKVFDFYRENAEFGEKLGLFIDRIGIEVFKKGVFSK